MRKKDVIFFQSRNAQNLIPLGITGEDECSVVGTTKYPADI